MVLMDVYYRKKLVYKFIEHAIKMNPWKAQIPAYFPKFLSWFKGSSLVQVLLIFWIRATPVQVVSFHV
jgi:hypothetical protein